MCAETYADVEPVRALLWYAAFAWDERQDDASAVAAMLQAQAADAATAATTTCVQVYGGMGFTHECDVHIWFKRAGYDRQALGTPGECRRAAAAIVYG
jgi:alkylation response protein AidB-like acyl-CoA dehydrogenase